MKATNNRLSYWKARKMDAQAAIQQAKNDGLMAGGIFYDRLVKCLQLATKKVNQLEREKGVSNG